MDTVIRKNAMIEKILRFRKVFLILLSDAHGFSRKTSTRLSCIKLYFFENVTLFHMENNLEMKENFKDKYILKCY